MHRSVVDAQERAQCCAERRRPAARAMLPPLVALAALLLLARPARTPVAVAQAAQVTASHYVLQPWISSTLSTLGQQSCAQSGFLFLDFGRPWQPQGGPQSVRWWVDNVALPVVADPGVTDSVEQRVEDFITGYYSCGSGPLTLAIGTQNRPTPDPSTGGAPYTNDVTYDHGSKWGTMTARVRAWIDGQHLSQTVSVRGAIDAEPSVGPQASVQSWTDGFHDGRITTSYPRPVSCQPAGVRRQAVPPLHRGGGRHTA